MWRLTPSHIDVCLMNVTLDFGGGHWRCDSPAHYVLRVYQERLSRRPLLNASLRGTDSDCDSHIPKVLLLLWFIFVQLLVLKQKDGCVGAQRKPLRAPVIPKLNAANQSALRITLGMVPVVVL